MSDLDPRPETPATEAERKADKAWTRTPILVVVGFLLVFGALGFVVIPVSQGAQSGVDAWTAICRSLGISPGNPASRQPVSDAQALPVSRVAWTPSILNTLGGADRQLGADLATQVCSACHGDAGVSPSGAFPHLAGQSAGNVERRRAFTGRDDVLVGDLGRDPLLLAPHAGRRACAPAIVEPLSPLRPRRLRERGHVVLHHQERVALRAAIDRLRDRKRPLASGETSEEAHSGTQRRNGVPLLEGLQV